MLENSQTLPECDKPVQFERRISANRRRTGDRRLQEERRLDSRVSTVKLRRSIKTWIRSLTHLRLGVDRRKKGDRRRNEDRRQPHLRSILTREELADLLS